MTNAHRKHPQLYAYRQKTKTLRRHVQRTGQPCWLCGNPIDLDLPPTHPQAFTADHINALGNGGKLLGELKPAHRACNSSRGKKRTQDQITQPTTTRQW